MLVNLNCTCHVLHWKLTLNMIKGTIVVDIIVIRGVQGTLWTLLSI